MKAWFDLMVFPTLILIIGAFHWISDSLLFDLAVEKEILEQSKLAENFANNLLIGNCTSTTHHLLTVPPVFGDYRVFRISLVAGVPKILIVGKDNG